MKVRQKARSKRRKPSAKDLESLVALSAAPLCICCGSSQTSTEGFLLQCDACKRAYYCSMECFNVHSPEHVKTCSANRVGGRDSLSHRPQSVAEEPAVPSSPSSNNEDAQVKRVFTSGSCTESDTASESRDRSRRRKEKQRRSDNVKRTFQYGSCTESDTENERPGPRVQRKARNTRNESKPELPLLASECSVHVENIAADGEDRPEEADGTANTLSEPTGDEEQPQHIKRVFKYGSCSESDTETESMVKKRSGRNPSSVVKPLNSNEVEGEKVAVSERDLSLIAQPVLSEGAISEMERIVETAACEPTPDSDGWETETGSNLAEESERDDKCDAAGFHTVMEVSRRVKMLSDTDESTFHSNSSLFMKISQFDVSKAIMNMAGKPTESRSIVPQRNLQPVQGFDWSAVRPVEQAPIVSAASSYASDDEEFVGNFGLNIGRSKVRRQARQKRRNQGRRTRETGTTSDITMSDEEWIIKCEPRSEGNMSESETTVDEDWVKFIQREARTGNVLCLFSPIGRPDCPARQPYRRRGDSASLGSDCSFDEPQTQRKPPIRRSGRALLHGRRLPQRGLGRMDTSKARQGIKAESDRKTATVTTKQSGRCAAQYQDDTDSDGSDFDPSIGSLVDDEFLDIIESRTHEHDTADNVTDGSAIGRLPSKPEISSSLVEELHYGDLKSTSCDDEMCGIGDVPGVEIVRSISSIPSPLVAPKFNGSQAVPALSRCHLGDTPGSRGALEQQNVVLPSPTELPTRCASRSVDLVALNAQILKPESSALPTPCDGDDGILSDMPYSVGVLSRSVLVREKKSVFKHQSKSQCWNELDALLLSTGRESVTHTGAKEVAVGNTSYELTDPSELERTDGAALSTEDAEWSDCDDTEIEETRARRGGGYLGYSERKLATRSRNRLARIRSANRLVNHSVLEVTAATNGPTNNRAAASGDAVKLPVGNKIRASCEVEETRKRSGGGMLGFSPPTTPIRSSLKSGLSLASPTLKHIERIRLELESKKPEWTEAQLRKTEQSELMKASGTLSPTRSKQSVLPDWTRQNILRPTTKGQRLRRQESVGSGCNRMHPTQNESIRKDDFLALTSKARLRRTPKGDLLKKGQSIRLKKDCTFQIGSDLQVADKSLSRRDIFGSRTSAAAKSGAKKAETAPSHTDRRLLLNQSKHVPGANGDAGVNVEMHGSFRVVRGDSAMTLNVVKLERAEPNTKPLALLRSTPRGAMLMKGDSIRGGRVTKQVGLLGDLDVSEASDLDTPFDVTPCALET